MIDEGKINFSIAAQQLLPACMRAPETAPATLAAELELLQENDDTFIAGIVEEALAAFPDKVTAYRNGKTGLLGMFMGEVMKRSGGKVDPKTATRLLKEKLDNI